MHSITKKSLKPSPLGEIARRPLKQGSSGDVPTIFNPFFSNSFLFSAQHCTRGLANFAIN